MQDEIKAYEKRKANLKRQVDKRRLELGVTGINDGDKPVAIRDASVPSSQLGLILPNLYVYDIVLDFEDFEKGAIDILMKSKAKLWHGLFQKFANKGMYRVKTL